MDILLKEARALLATQSARIAELESEVAAYKLSCSGLSQQVDHQTANVRTVIASQVKLIKQKQELEAKVKHWKSNHDQRVLACEFLKQRLDMPVERIGAYQKMLDLQEELRTTELLLETQYKVIDAIPECPAHGSRCVPHAVEWIKRIRGLMGQSYEEPLV